MWLLVKYILTAAVRDRILISFLVLMGVGASLSIFLGSSSVTEKDQVSLVFTASMLRFSSILTLVMFCVFYIRKSFDTLDVEFMLTRPLTRLQYLTSHFIAFTFLALLMTLLATLALFLMPSKGDFMGTVLWALSLFIELSIMASIAIFFSFFLSSAVSAALVSFAFYVLARMIGGIIGVINATPETSVMLLMEKLMLLISIFIPRLDLMGQGNWLLYGTTLEISWLFIIGQGFVFIGLIFSATLIDFKNKQF